MPSYLASIVDAHRAMASEDRRDLDGLIRQAEAVPAPRAFAESLSGHAAAAGMAVISEIKRRSPSKGALDEDLDPAAVAADYQAGGAACLSVLTDRRFFGGSPDDLVVARRACDLPVLRKDFTVSLADVCDARLMGADAVLLIVAALSDAELSAFRELAEHLQMTALVEIHDAVELERALVAGATTIGINQRNLSTFEVDRALARSLAADLPTGTLRIAESGIRDATDVAELAAAGFDAVLVGESLIRAGDRRAAVAGLGGAGR